MNRLLTLHFSSPPDAGGLEIASWELAAAANRYPHWEGATISGTQISQDCLKETPHHFWIPEIGPTSPIRNEIFEYFRCGKTHPSVYPLSLIIEEKLKEILGPGDLLVSFNSFSQPFCVPLTLALRRLSTTKLLVLKEPLWFGSNPCKIS